MLHTLQTSHINLINKVKVVVFQLVSCVQLCNPMDCSTPGFLVLHSPLSPGVCSDSTSVESVMSSHHLILCRPFLLLPSIFPSIRVFSSVSPLCIKWPKYWSFGFSISPSSEYPGLISFRIGWVEFYFFTFNLVTQHSL